MKATGAWPRTDGKGANVTGTAVPNETETPLARHALIRVDPGAWSRAVAADLPDDPLVTGWAARGWPVVARRRMAGDAVFHVPVGLPLPPAQGKRRLALAIPDAAVRAVGRPVTLRAARAGAPPCWIATMAAVGALGERYGVEPRVFGSFAWQALTGLDYVTSASDLDLLWPLSPETPRLLGALDVIGASAPGRIDGEVVHRGEAVQWRELHGAIQGGTGDVLVKTLDGVALREARDFLRPDFLRTAM